MKFRLQFFVMLQCIFRIQERINQRRREKEEQEKQRAIDLEKLRRKDGKDLSKIKSEYVELTI